MIPLTIWMNMPSFYQEDLFKSLVDSGEVELQVVYARDLPVDRQKLGWQTELAHYPYHILTAQNRIGDAVQIARRSKGRFHIVNGIWAEPAFAAALLILGLTRSPFAIYSEASDPQGSSFFPQKQIKKLCARWVANKTKGLLSVSHLSSDFYGQFGFTDALNYPFGYFLPGYSQSVSQPAPHTNDAQVEIIFVGQIVPRKGTDILIEALLPLFAEHKGLHLTIVGGGEQAPALRERVSSEGIGGRVSFEGVLPSNQVRSRMATADLLVLPSRFDGWGLVVNEAFSVGIPVIVSGMCGAADIVQHGVSGYVFRSKDALDLRACLRDFLNSKHKWSKMRAAALDTGQSVSIEVVTPYLIACINHMLGRTMEKPVPPWAWARAA
jgi:glycosyltransferase involved in cell wall biosynthesis